MKHRRLVACCVFLLCLGGVQYGHSREGMENGHVRSVSALWTMGLEQKKGTYYAGLRRSAYGLVSKNQHDKWWAEQAREFAGVISDVQAVEPVIIQIISVYLNNGTTRFGFERPARYRGSKHNMTFRPGPIDHERALTTYDRRGVKAIVQIESGNADVLSCLNIAHLQFGHHPCIIGYGIDAEWYFTRESKDNTGLPLRDEEVKRWVQKILSFDPRYTLFLKHWKPDHMPPTYRHPNLWFLSDSQDFPSLEKLLDDLRSWDDAHKDHVVGYQYGYEADRRWWMQMRHPPADISRAILRDIPNTRFLFWVDSTADKVAFGSEEKS